MDTPRPNGELGNMTTALDTLLDERLRNTLDKLDSEKRHPTRAEAALAAAILNRCTGHDLGVWTDGLWPDESSGEALALIAADLFKNGKAQQNDHH